MCTQTLTRAHTCARNKKHARRLLRCTRQAYTNAHRHIRTHKCKYTSKHSHTYVYGHNCCRNTPKARLHTQNALGACKRTAYALCTYNIHVYAKVHIHTCTSTHVHKFRIWSYSHMYCTSTHTGTQFKNLHTIHINTCTHTLQKCTGASVPTYHTICSQIHT